MVTRACLLAAVTALFASTAFADDSPNDGIAAETAAEPASVHHAPVLVSDADRTVALTLEVDGTIERAHLIYQREDGPLQHRPFVDETATRWTVTVPADVVAPPGFGYTIEVLERVGGEEHRRAVFASRDDLHHVQVAEPMGDVVERRLLERLDGRRHEVTASGEWVGFGSATVVTEEPGTYAARRSTVDDHYWRAEARYDYRFLTVAYSLGLRLGVLRGTSPIEDAGPTANEAASESSDAGLNYAVPELRLRFHDVFHMDVGLVVGVNDEGFAFGGAGALHLGDLLGPRLTLGFEGVQQLGVTARSQVHLPVVDWLELAPAVELTNLPVGSRFGMRMLGDVVVRPGAGFSIRARGGYQTRFAHGGGPTIGGGVGYAF